MIHTSPRAIGRVSSVGTLLVIGLAVALVACSSNASDSTVESTSTTTESMVLTTDTQSTTTALIEPPADSTTASPPVSSPTATSQPPVPEGGLIGFVGCSVTNDAVTGYGDVGGARFWSTRGDYGGGSVGRWAQGVPGVNGLWQSFDDQLAAQPSTELLWWELCTLRATPQDGLDSALIVLEALRGRIPGVTIFVSAQPDYQPVGLCDISGATGPEKMADLASQLVNEQGLMPGPVLGPLTEGDTTNGGCRANETGRELFGNQLLSFFGASA